jgi:hypothetical protein
MPTAADYLAISVLPDVAIRISASWPEGASNLPGAFKLHGPNPTRPDDGPPGSEDRRLTEEEILAFRTMEGLSEEVEAADTAMSGTLSPLGEVTVPMGVRPDVGIPDGVGTCGGTRVAKEAKYYCFIQPLNDQEVRDMIRAQVKLAMKINSWAFVLLQGGYAYFDEERKLVRVNAITLAQGAGVDLILAGHEVPDAGPALEAMQHTKRMVDIHEPDLVEAGFVAYGWVHGREDFDGAPVTTVAPYVNQLRIEGKQPVPEVPDHRYPDGAFLYEQKGKDGRHRIYMYPLMTTVDSNYGKAQQLTKRQVQVLMDDSEAEFLTEEERTASRLPTDSLASAYSAAIQRSVHAEEGQARAKELEEKTRKLRAARRAPEQTTDAQTSKRNLVCRVLETNVGESLSKLLPYLGVGLLFYANGGASVGWDDVDTGSGAVDGSWSTVESFYFAVVTMSTVGYGDLAPESTFGKLFTAVYILVGVLIIFTECGELYEAATETIASLWTKLTKWLPYKVQTAIDPQSYLQLAVDMSTGVDIEDDEGSDEEEEGQQEEDDDDEKELQRCTKKRCCCCCMESRKWRFFSMKLTVPVVGGVGLCVFASAAVFTKLRPELSYTDAVWHCWVTSTTVGYGDQICGGAGCAQEDRATDATLIWAAVHIIISVSWLSSTAGKVSDTIQDWTWADQERVWLRKLQKLTHDLLLDLDASVPTETRTDADKGLDEVEFLVGMLIEQGATVFGKPLSYEEHVKPHRKRFRDFDGDKSGYLDTADLCHMVAESEQANRSSMRNMSNPVLNAAISFAKEGDWSQLETALYPDGGYGGGHKCMLSEELINTIPKGRKGTDRRYGLLHQLAAWHTPDALGRNGETEFRKLVAAGVKFDTAKKTTDGLTCEQVAMQTRPPHPKFIAVLEGYRAEQVASGRLHKILNHAGKAEWADLEGLLFPEDPPAAAAGAATGAAAGSVCALSVRAINSRPEKDSGGQRDYNLLHQLASWASERPGRDGRMMDGAAMHRLLVDRA